MAREALVKAFLAGNDRTEIAAKAVLRRYVSQLSSKGRRKPQRRGRPVQA